MSDITRRPGANISVVILEGGLGTRPREETAFRPKPMVEVGGRPILWHIMKIYDHFGFRWLILPVGYLGDMIKAYFLSYADGAESDYGARARRGIADGEGAVWPDAHRCGGNAWGKSVGQGCLSEAS